MPWRALCSEIRTSREWPGDLRHRATLGGFEHRERATEDPRIRGLSKRLFELPTLGCGKE